MADGIVSTKKRKYISFEDIDSTLECQVCMELPMKPVFQCKNGHIYCKTCGPKLKNCPSCKVKLNKRDPIRSLVADKLLDMEFSLDLVEKRQKADNPIQLSLHTMKPECDKEWKCQNCTLVNEDHTNVCQMCSKSRLTTESLKTTNPTRISETLQRNEWKCHFCTYLNEESIRTCQMCAKSRPVLNHQNTISSLTRNDDMQQTENSLGVGSSIQSVSGPAIRYLPQKVIECTRCTYINNKSLQMCHACGVALHTQPPMQ